MAGFLTLATTGNFDGHNAITCLALTRGRLAWRINGRTDCRWVDTPTFYQRATARYTVMPASYRPWCIADDPHWGCIIMGNQPSLWTGALGWVMPGELTGTPSVIIGPILLVLTVLPAAVNRLGSLCLGVEPLQKMWRRVLKNTFMVSRTVERDEVRSVRCVRAFSYKYYSVWISTSLMQWNSMNHLLIRNGL